MLGELSLPQPMHILQPKHTKIKTEEAKALLTKYNLAISQIPRIKSGDPAVPEGCVPGDILKIERKKDGEGILYFRVVA